MQGVSRPYTTQLYFSDDVDRVKDNFYMRELEVQVEDLPDGTQARHLHFVIQQVTEKENVTPESLAARLKRPISVRRARGAIQRMEPS